ncbi:FxSxx-COOH system tetratricopeptide repeat protein [Catellatospora citrea]|uniref:FxSxx-COOH system tetratricopeptide repeat protein n=1 Tax=Catellatospora citrea TaxID=53366 RepID=UPI003400EA8A
MQPAQQSGDGRHAQRALSTKELLRLKDALMKVEVIVEPPRRQAVLELLRDEFPGDFDPQRFNTSEDDSWSVLKRCVRLGGVAVLRDTLALVGGRTAAWLNFAAVADELFPAAFFMPADQALLVPLLKRLPDHIAAPTLKLAKLESIDAVIPVGPPGVQVAFDRVLRAHEQKTVPDASLWLLLELFAHQSADATADFHNVIAAAAGRVGAYQLTRDLCVEAAALLRETAERVTPDFVDGDEGYNTLQNGVNTDTGDEMSRVALMPRASNLQPEVMRGLPQRNSHFSGRAETLVGLHERLESGATTVILPTALHGLGGVGKTSIAVEYAYRYRTSYDLIWWVPAAEEQDIRRSITSLGRTIGVPDTPDVEYMIDSTLDMLRRGEKFGRWLLVFDNATEPAVVQRYLPGDSGRVLITSRNAGWRMSTDFVEVDVFTPEESREFLGRTWSELTPSEADQLAERLGGLPLALTLAAAFHSVTGMPLSEYLESYDRVVPLLMYDTTPDNKEPVGVTWRISFDKVASQVPAAAQLLQLCAFLGTEPIAIPMLREGRGAALSPELKQTLRDELLFRKAVQVLGTYALVTIDTKRDLMSVHALVGAVLRAGLDEADHQRVRNAAHEVLALANPGPADRSDTWGRHRQIAPHVLPSGSIQSDDPHVRQIAIDQVRYFFAIGDFLSSRTLAERTLEDWVDRLGPDDVMTLRMRFHRGNALRSLGEYEAARTETQDAYDALVRTLGASHEYTLAVANSLGAGLRFLGDFKQALANDERTYELHQQTFEEANISTLRAANNVAVDLRFLGRFAEARKLDQANVDHLKESDPANSGPVSLQFVNNLVRDLIGLGEYAEALRMQEERIAAFSDRLGKHPLLIVARRNLAVLHRKLGNTARARELAQAVLEAAEETHGTTHESYFASLLTLSNALRAEKEFVAARKYCAAADTAYRGRFGEDHPFTLACDVNLAVINRGSGMVAEARAADERSMSVLRELLGEGHPYTLACLANHTNNLAHAGEHEAALKLSREVHELSLSHRPINHPDTLLAAVNLVLDLYNAGKHAEADTLRAHTLHQMRIILGPEHPETVSAERGRRAEIDIEVPQV